MTVNDPSGGLVAASGVTQAEYHAMQAAHMTEAQLQAVILGAARRRGWLVYHTYDSRRSASGYPDLHLVHAGKGLSMLRELKSVKGRLSAAQGEWMTALQAAGVDAGLWRPSGWFDGTIDAQLDGTPLEIKP